MCASDQLALALVDLLRTEGVDVPGTSWSRASTGSSRGSSRRRGSRPCGSPWRRWARAAARILIDTTTGTQPGEPVTLRLGTKLVVRESCGCRG
ncbi:hypothetical protein BC477_20470 [Clavibacter michiganensis subsp. michiganensis]|nr:hypothetical protein BC477_20470 [Clavibacter michiganensis subsp. michiganensis]